MGLEDCFFISVAIPHEASPTIEEVKEAHKRVSISEAYNIINH